MARDWYSDYKPPPRRRSTFGTAFGVSSGLMIGIAAVVCGLALLACGGCLVAGCIGTSVAPKPDGTSGPPAGSGEGNKPEPQQIRESTYPSIGDAVVITAEVVLGSTEENHKEALKLLRANDEVGLTQMEFQGRLFLVDRGTEGKLLEGGFFTMRVRITTGPHAGKAGYITSDFVKKKPADRPIPPETTKQRQPEPEKQAPAPEPEQAKRREPRKENPPPPEEERMHGMTVAERQDLYKVVNGTRAAVETAAIAKFGRKPGSMDPGSVRIPYQAFVETEMDKRLKALEKSTGRSVEVLTAVLTEGDRERWPK